jgi:hypothetical protein
MAKLDLVQLDTKGFTEWMCAFGAEQEQLCGWTLYKILSDILNFFKRHNLDQE